MCSANADHIERIPYEILGNEEVELDKACDRLQSSFPCVAKDYRKISMCICSAYVGHLRQCFLFDPAMSQKEHRSLPFPTSGPAP